MKKRIALLLAALLAVGSLTACGGGNGDVAGTEGGNAAAGVKVGVGASTDFTYGSHTKGDVKYDGSEYPSTVAQADIHVAAVMLDAEGKIVQCVIDAVQVGAEVSETGEIAEDVLATKFQTKVELGDAYGMQVASPLANGEWDDQALAFQTWCVGKTADEVAASVGEDGKPNDDMLLTGCTIKTNEIVAAVVDACANATAEGASATDVLGLGMTAELSQYAAPSTDEEGNAVDGKVQAYVNYAAVAQNAEGKITSVLIDSIQATSTWDAEGKLTTDMTADVLTKYEKKEAYGMQVASSLEKGEWYQQIDVFKGFILGKTADEVTAIAVDESGYPTDDMLVTGCTMKVAAYKEAVAKALAK